MLIYELYTENPKKIASSVLRGRRGVCHGAAVVHVCQSDACRFVAVVCHNNSRQTDVDMSYVICKRKCSAKGIGWSCNCQSDG